MRSTKVLTFLMALVLMGTTPVFGADTDVLTGDTALACEALLCLSSSSPPAECAEALSRYYSIHRSKSWKTARDRQRFLDQCPTVDTATVTTK